MNILERLKFMFKRPKHVCMNCEHDGPSNSVAVALDAHDDDVNPEHCEAGDNCCQSGACKL